MGEKLSQRLIFIGQKEKELENLIFFLPNSVIWESKSSIYFGHATYVLIYPVANPETWRYSYLHLCPSWIKQTAVMFFYVMALGVIDESDAFDQPIPIN